MTDPLAPQLVILGATIQEAEDYYRELVSFDPSEVFGYKVRALGVQSRGADGMIVDKIIATPHALASHKGREMISLLERNLIKGRGRAA